VFEFPTLDVSPPSNLNQGRVVIRQRGNKLISPPATAFDLDHSRHLRRSSITIGTKRSDEVTHNGYHHGTTNFVVVTIMCFTSTNTLERLHRNIRFSNALVLNLVSPNGLYVLAR
jgi:hypothetical protein